MMFKPLKTTLDMTVILHVILKSGVQHSDVDCYQYRPSVIQGNVPINVKTKKQNTGVHFHLHRDMITVSHHVNVTSIL
jgi:hypothetical protein